MTHIRARSVNLLAVTLVAAMVSGCSGGGMPSLSDMNPFKEKEEVLPGTRVAVLDRQDALATQLEAASGEAVQLPAAQSNSDWSQPGGVASNSPGHLALSGSVKVAWTADAGTGSSSRGRLSAAPIVYQGRVYTLDTVGRVSAFSASGGGRLWRVSLVPEHEDGDEGFGGGIAADGNLIFVATGFGLVYALDASSGNKVWEKKIGLPMRDAPTTADGKVFVSDVEGVFYCLAAADGNEIWTYRGVGQTTSIITGASPAVAGDMVVVPYSSGDVVAVKLATGEPYWSESLSRARMSSSLASMSDPGSPAIADGIVYAVGHSGRMVATSQQNGERLWSQSIRSTQRPWVAGDVVYVVDVSGRVMALSRKSGGIRWATKLPGEGLWVGPVLAGNRLWLASTKGKLVSVDAALGKVEAQSDLGDPVYIPPVVAGGRMYILTDEARLMALN